MRSNFKHPIIKRLRKSENDFYRYLRLHRAEFGHSINKKKTDTDYYGYYPDVTKLIKRLSIHLKIQEKNLILGLGAESIIKDILFFFSKTKKNIGYLSPNYFMYNIYSKLFGYKLYDLKINPEKPNNLNVFEIKRFLIKKKIDIFLIVNPSHPFEKNWSLKEIKEIIKFCKKKNIIVIVDEVYQGLGSKTSKKLVHKYDNLLIIGSFSKNFGLPALRIGYLISSKKNIEFLESFRLAIELPAHSIKIALDFLERKQKIRASINQIINARNFAHKEFKKRNIKSFGMFGNSVTFKSINHISAKKIGNFLKKNKILVNYNYKKPFDNFINLTTTNINNLKIFFKRLDQIL